jgi:putative PIN family toxin of toxin-antitoxin system
LRAVLDTNLFLSALLSARGAPAVAVEAWRAGRFELVTSREQIAELKRAVRYEKLRRLISRAALGRLVNGLHTAEILLVRLRYAGGSPDPDDDYLLAMAAAADADYLVTGDRALLRLRRFAHTRVVTPRRFAGLLGG